MCDLAVLWPRSLALLFTVSQGQNPDVPPPRVRMTWQSLFPGSFRLWAESASCAWRAEVPSPCWLRGGLSLVPARFPCVSLTLGLCTFLVCRIQLQPDKVLCLRELVGLERTPHLCPGPPSCFKARALIPPAKSLVSQVPGGFGRGHLQAFLSWFSPAGMMNSCIFEDSLSLALKAGWGGKHRDHPKAGRKCRRRRSSVKRRPSRARQRPPG